MKEFSKFELARLKRTAQNVDGYLKTKAKLNEKIAELKAQLEEVQKNIELTDAPTVAMTGYHTEDLFKKVVTPTDKVDKEGKIIKKVSIVLKYPDTIIPPIEEASTPSDEVNVNFNETIDKVVEDTVSSIAPGAINNADIPFKTEF